MHSSRAENGEPHIDSLASASTEAPLETAPRGRTAARVFVAEADAPSRDLALRALAGSEFHAEAIDDAEDACQRLARDPQRFVLVCNADGTPGALLDALRAAGRAPLAAIVTLAPAQHAAIPAALARGFDDALVKPLTASYLLHRLRAVVRRHGERGAPALARSLREALRHPLGGEVVVRCRERVGRIFVARGQVAWAHCTDMPAGLHEILRAAGVALTPVEVSSVLADARDSGKHFADLLVAWRLVDEDAMRGAIRAVVGQRLQALLDLEDSRSMFLPSERAWSGRYAFDTVDLVGTPDPAHGSLAPEAGTVDAIVVPPLRTPSFDAPGAGPRERGLLASVMALDGARGALLLDAERGVTAASVGQVPDAGTIWSCVGVVGPSAAHGGELIFSDASRLLFLAALPERERWYLLAEFDPRATSMGLVRRMVSEQVAALARPTEP